MNSSEDFRLFLNEFVNGHLAKSSDEKALPFRLLEQEIRESEITGHCCQWAAEYLFTQ